MHEIVVVSAVRTPIGKFQGALSSVSAPALGARAIATAVERASLPPERVDHVFFGNVLQAGVGQAPGRQAALGAGLPASVGVVTVNKVCGSGMRAMMDAANALRCDEFKIVVAGGMESMSNAPYALPALRAGARMGNTSAVDTMVHDGLWDPYRDQHMGQCAELCARKYGLTRESQDAFALESYRRAQAATQEGKFSAELVPVHVPQRKGKPIQVLEDEEPFASPLEKVPQLKPAFDPNAGSITAANASKINDGASALVLMRADHAKELGLPPLARLVSQASFAQEPEWFTTAPTQAILKALKLAGISKSEITRWEINEAFANVTMAATLDLGLDPTTVNVHGGSVALGHPIGASGARIVTTLLHAMIQDRQRYGCAAICIGGGEATAVVLERM